MKLKYLAHAAFLITSAKGTKILTDPYEPGGFNGAISYEPIDEQADIITVSHDHADHAYIASHHKNVQLIKDVGSHRIGGYAQRAYGKENRG